MIVRIFLLAVISVFSLPATSQTKTYFEGTITYKFSFKADRIPNPEKILNPYFGKGSTLYFKEGNYRHEYEGGPLEYDLYIKTENKMYLKKRDNDTLYWSDCSIRGDSIHDFSYTPQIDTVMGIICDRLSIQYKDKLEIQYYNSDSIRVNPDWFENFKRKDEYLIDRKEKSIYLKSENFFDQFSIIETAVEINVESINIEKFKLPANPILVQRE